MSSHLQRWGRRAQGTAPSLTPRLPSRFEAPGGLPAAPVDSPLPTMEEPLPAAPAQTPPTPAGHPPEASPQRSPLSPAPTRDPSRPAPAPTPSLPPDSPSSALPRVPTDNLAPGDRTQTAPGFSREPAPSGTRPPANPLTPSPVLRPPAPNATPGRRDESGSPRPQPDGSRADPAADLASLQTELGRLRAWMETPAEPLDSRKATGTPASHATPGPDLRTRAPAGSPSVLRPAALPPAPAETAPRPEAVHVHIDTVILRAATPTPARSPAAATAASPAQDRVARLNQYLTRRNPRRT